MARSFNGTTDALTAATLTNLGSNAFGLADFTIAGWVFLVTNTVDQYVNLTYTGNGAANGMGIYARTTSGAGFSHHWVLLYGNVAFTDGNSVLSAGSWNHLCAVCHTPSGGDAKLYLNGSQVNSTTGGSGPQAASGGNTTIGANTGGADVCHIADVAFWKTQLTPTEVASLASVSARPGAVQSGSLIAYWPVTRTNSPELDLSGNSNNAVVTGTTFATDPPGFGGGGTGGFRRSLSALGTRTGSRQLQGAL